MGTIRWVLSEDYTQTMITADLKQAFDREIVRFVSIILTTDNTL